LLLLLLLGFRGQLNCSSCHYQRWPWMPQQQQRRQQQQQ
jgi:hypothetical protein